jgi:hypothetical protein
MQHSLFKHTLAATLIVAALIPLNARVFIPDNNDIRIVGIPMLKQQGSGYCAPAALAMALEYKNMLVDQATIGKWAQSTNEAGTDLQAMYDAINARSDELNVKISPISDFDIKKIRSTVNEYNVIAMKQSKPLLQINANENIYLAELFKDANIAILRETVSYAEKKRFAKAIRNAIKKDKPVLWGMILGVAPEEKLIPTANGGHLRLITGISADDKYIFYCDPWGEEHAKKKMLLIDAAAVTFSLHCVE